MASRLEWHGEVVKKFIGKASWTGILLATEVLVTELVLTLNVPNTGVSVKRKRGRGSYTIYPNPSEPKHPPHKRTGFLQAHVGAELDEKALQSRVGVGTNAKYGLYLELGTRYIEPRPWLLATVEKVWDKLQAAIKAGSQS